MNASHLSISVIIPLHNGGRFISQALDSIFAQSLPATEVIVVDDGSTDDGPDVVSRYVTTHQVVLFRKKNEGQSSARNFGVHQSHGKLIALLDQDDCWYRDHLKELAGPFSDDMYDPPGWVYSNLDEITEDGRLRARATLSVQSGIHPKLRLDDCLCQDMFVLPSASMISRAAFDAVGGFDEELSGYEDDDLFIRLFVAGYRNVYIKQPLGQWRIYPKSSSFAPQMAQSRMRYACKLIRLFPDEPALSRYYVRDLIAPRFLRQMTEAARIALRLGDPKIIATSMENISILEHHAFQGRKLYPMRRDLLITAIIPLYNGAPFIRQCLQSVFDQALVPDEIIVVDDGSTDSGPDIVAEMARSYPIRLLRTENGGQSCARNIGVDHAHGDLIALLDQDDIWYPDHLLELVKPFLETRAVELGWTYSNLDEIDEAGEMIAHAILRRDGICHPKRDLAGCLKQDMFVLPSASLISRRAFHVVGGFDERLSGYEDDDFFLRLFQAGFDNVFVPASLSKWRIYPTSSSYSPRMAVSRAIYARKLISRFPNEQETSRWYVRDMIAPRFFQTMAGEMRKAALKGTKEQRQVALANLIFITGHLRLAVRLPLEVVFLPALHFLPLARFIMRHRIGLYGFLRRVFGQPSKL